MPDSSFGNNGKTIVPNQSDLTGGVTKIGIQSYGGIVVGGGSSDIIVARFAHNGVPDLGFGNSFTFKAITDFGNRHEVGFDMTIDDQDRILVTGISWPPPGQPGYDTRVIVVRYLPNGQLDKGFKDHEVLPNYFLCDLQASCGRQYIYPDDKYNPHQYPSQIIVKKENGDNLNGNKILITGNFGTARLAENGTLDHTFGYKGLIAGLIKGSVAVRTDNKMVFLESNQSNKTIEIYKENGQLDDDVVSNDCVFDPSVNISFQNYTVEGLSNLKLDSNDRIIVSGNGNETSQTNSNSAFLARYKYSKCSKYLKYRDYYEYNPFVHPLDKVGPIWGGLENTTMNQYIR